MTINTQKLLSLFDAAAQAHGWAAYRGTRAHAQTALTNYQKARGDLEQALDAQAAEIERFRSMEDMLRSLPISTDRDRRMYGKGYFAGSRKRVLDLQRALCKAVDVILEKNAEIERLREAIQDAIRLLGMDRPIDPTDVLRAALSGESND